MTLSEAQKNFRAAPSRATALAYMDAAIAEWEDAPGDSHLGHRLFVERMREIRDWLMNVTLEPWPT